MFNGTNFGIKNDFILLQKFMTKHSDIFIKTSNNALDYLVLKNYLAKSRRKRLFFFKDLVICPLQLQVQSITDFRIWNIIHTLTMTLFVAC